MAKTKTSSKTKASPPIDPSISSLATTPIPSNLDEALDPDLSSSQPTLPSSSSSLPSSSSSLKKTEPKKKVVKKKKSQEPIVTVPNFSEEQIIQYHLLNPSVNPSFSSPFKTTADIYGAGRNRRSREPVKDEDRPRFSHPLPVIWLEQPQPPSSSGTISTKKKSGKGTDLKIKRIHISTRSATVPDQSNRLESTGNSAAFWLGGFPSNEDTISSQVVGSTTGSTGTANGVKKSEVNAKKSVAITEEADVHKSGTDKRKRKRKEEIAVAKEPEIETGKGKGKGKKAESEVNENTINGIKNGQTQNSKNKKSKSDVIVENQSEIQAPKTKARTKKQLKSSSPAPAPAPAIPVLTDQRRSLSESSSSSSSLSEESEEDSESDSDSDPSISNTNGIQYNSSSFTKPPPDYIRSSSSTSPIKQVPSKYIPISTPSQPSVKSISKSKSKSKSEFSKTETPTYTITPLSDSKFKKRLSLLPTLTPTSTNTNSIREGETSTPTPGEKKKKRTSTGIVGNSKKGPKWVTETPKPK